MKPDDDEFVPVSSSSQLNTRLSITNQRVIVETGHGNNHMETGMRFYDPTTGMDHSYFLIIYCKKLGMASQLI